MKHLGDICKLNGDTIPKVDIICGGSPCQDLSVAGKREGLSGERSGLFMEQIRIIKEMREDDRANGRADVDIRPRFMVWENVPGAFSSNKGEDFRCVLEETAKIADENAIIPRLETDKNGKQKWSKSGAIMGDEWSIAWRVHDAQFWGVPQRRKRISLVADFAGGAAPEILFEPKSLYGNTETSREEGQGTTTDVERSIGETSECLNSWDVQSKHIQPENGIAEALYSGECRGGGGESYVMQKTSESLSFQERAGKEGGGKGILIQKERTGALSTLNNQPVCYGISSYDSNAMKSSNPHSGIYEAETTRTLDNNGGNPACNQGGMAVVQGFDGYNQTSTGDVTMPLRHKSADNDHIPVVCIENHPNDSRVKIREDGKVQTLSSRMGTGGGNVPMVMESSNGDIAGTLYANEAYDKWSESEKGASLRASGGVYGGGSESLSVGHVVRRLTPLECERLQGYPDGWTDIGEWYDSKGKKHKGEADSPRYKALGNSIALPFWQWMAERMVKHIDHEATMGSFFDGIGGFPLVYSRVGCQPVWASEIEEFPIAVTKARFPDDDEN